MKLFLFIFISFFSNLPDMAESEKNDFDISGIVVEEGSGEPLTGAMIVVEGVESQYYTDFEGKFAISSLTPGKYNIEVSYVSFKSKHFKGLNLDRNIDSLLISLR